MDYKKNAFCFFVSPTMQDLLYHPLKKLFLCSLGLLICYDPPNELFLCSLGLLILFNPLKDLFLCSLVWITAAIWESLGLWLFTGLYDKLSQTQYNCQLRLLEEPPAPQQWKLVLKMLLCVMIRFYLRNVITGVWVATLAYAILKSSSFSAEEIFGNLKVPLGAIIYQIFFKYKIIDMMGVFISSTTKRLRRQPSRCRESPGVELSRGQPES